MRRAKHGLMDWETHVETNLPGMEQGAIGLGTWFASMTGLVPVAWHGWHHHSGARSR